MTKELAIIQKSLSPLVDESLALIIKKPEDMTMATTLLSKLNIFNDRIEAEKSRVTKPLLTALSAERSRWKPAEIANENAILHLRSELTRYQTALVAKSKAKEQAIAEKLKAGEIDLTKAVKAIEKIKPVADNIATTAGDVQFAEVKRFEVMDVVLLSSVENGKYIEPNETKIREAMKAGVELSGVRYFTEQQVRNYR